MTTRRVRKVSPIAISSEIITLELPCDEVFTYDGYNFVSCDHWWVSVGPNTVIQTADQRLFFVSGYSLQTNRKYGLCELVFKLEKDDEPDYLSTTIGGRKEYIRECPCTKQYTNLGEPMQFVEYPRYNFQI